MTLQVLKGSHKCGRIDHITVDGQQGADVARVKEIAKQVPLEYVELERGKYRIYVYKDAS